MATPTVALASTKGGVGKTTIAFSLAAELARRLRTRLVCSATHGSAGLLGCVVCLDADPNRTLAEAIRVSGIPELRVIETDGERILAALREAQASADVVLIDLEGTANQAMLYACGKADLVLVPAQPSRFDVIEAVKTVGVVRQAADLVGREIVHRIVLSRTPVLRQRVADHSRAQFEKAGLPLLPVELVQRTAFQTMTYTGVPPYQQDPEGGAAANVERLTDSVVDLLGIDLAPAGFAVGEGTPHAAAERTLA
jgi:chromosome partitioning protein